jgi:hypothetical protein
MIDYPVIIRFSSVASSERRNYFDALEPHLVENPDDIVLQGNCYITNDEEDMLYYLIDTARYPLGITRGQVAQEISQWLMGRNVYYNIMVMSRQNYDITIDDVPVMRDGFLHGPSANLVVHAIHKSTRSRKGFPIYNLAISS